MRLGAGLIVLTAMFALVGCGGHKQPGRATSVGPIGKGAAGVWLYRPAGKPKDLVIYFHGQGGPTEATPENHLAWIRHLVARGSVVVYPRYEMAYEVDPMEYVVAGVRTATERADVDGLPVMALGYSRGGAIAVEYGAVAEGNDLPVPGLITSIFPAGRGNQDEQIDLTSLDHSTVLVMMIGDQDTVVGQTGASYLSSRLQAGGFPGEGIQLDFVESHGAFRADHFAPLRTSPGARAAFWQPVDGLLDALDQS